GDSLRGGPIDRQEDGTHAAGPQGTLDDVALADDGALPDDAPRSHHRARIPPADTPCPATAPLFLRKSAVTGLSLSPAALLPGCAVTDCAITRLRCNRPAL